MPREKEGYRLTLEWLNEKFPDKDFFNKAEVADLLGRDIKTVRRTIQFNERTGLVSKPDLARQVCV